MSDIINPMEEVIPKIQLDLDYPKDLLDEHLKIAKALLIWGKCSLEGEQYDPENTNGNFWELNRLPSNPQEVVLHLKGEGTHIYSPKFTLTMDIVDETLLVLVNSYASILGVLTPVAASITPIVMRHLKKGSKEPMIIMPPT